MVQVECQLEKQGFSCPAVLDLPEVGPSNLSWGTPSNHFHTSLQVILSSKHSIQSSNTWWKNVEKDSRLQESQVG